MILTLVFVIADHSRVAGRTPPDWRAIAQGDLEAGYRLLRDSHPGSAAPVGDVAFRHALAAARREGLTDAAAVRDETGYRRLIARFAASFGDPHIRFQPWPPPQASHGRQEAAFLVNGDEVQLRLPALDRSAASVVEEASRSAPVLARAKRITVDLRGNGGGDSAIGDRLIPLLFPVQPGWTRAMVPAPDCPILWRASVGNAAAVADLARVFAAQGDERAEFLMREAQLLQRAAAAGRPFAVDPPGHCLARKKQSPPRRPPNPRVRVITDDACFSSCLILLERLLLLGARQIGTATASSNWYMDVRTQPLPSGHGDLTTPQKVDFRRSEMIGPFIPDNN